jgi:hypothetical protein
MTAFLLQCRQNLLRIASELNDRAHQFRVVEKRLLVRFKDRNPAPLNNLDLLLRSTHEQLIALGNKVGLQCVSSRCAVFVYCLGGLCPVYPQHPLTPPLSPGGLCYVPCLCRRKGVKWTWPTRRTA